MLGEGGEGIQGLLAKHQLPPSVTTAFRRRPSPSDQPKPSTTLLQQPLCPQIHPLNPPAPHSPNQGRPRTERAKLLEFRSPHTNHTKNDQGLRTQVSAHTPLRASPSEKGPSIHPSRGPLQPSPGLPPTAPSWLSFSGWNQISVDFKNLSAPPGSTPGSQLKRLKNKQTFRAGAWPRQG